MEHIGRYFISNSHAPSSEFIKRLEELIDGKNIPLIRADRFDPIVRNDPEMKAPAEPIESYIERHSDVIFQIGEFINPKAVELAKQYKNVRVVSSSLMYDEQSYQLITDCLEDRFYYLPWWATWYTFWQDNYWQESYTEKPYMFDILMFQRKPERSLLFDQIVNCELEPVSIMTYHGEHPEYSRQWDHINHPRIDDVINYGSTTLHVDEPGTFSSLIPTEIYKNSHFSIVAETTVDGNRYAITEKTGKVLTAGRLTVWVAVWQFVDHLRSLGFDVFDDVIDHSYDNIKNSNERISAAVQSARALACEDPKRVFDHTHKRRLENRKLAQHYHHNQAQEAERVFAKWFN